LFPRGTWHCVTLNRNPAKQSRFEDCAIASGTGGRDSNRKALEFYRVLFDARATNSSNLESKSFRMGDWFDFL